MDTWTPEGRGVGVVANAWEVCGDGDSPSESQLNREMERLTKRR
ncbi:MAG: hypothetical protein Q7J48_18535 [Nocardioides sp.]|nr:hypothetical protein [Nocardioides sp.]